jgi:hypothetical protein
MKYYTYLHITKENPKWNEILKVVKDIQAKDPTFKHRTSEAGEIVIESSNRDTAYRRGSWFHHKHGLKYTVIEGKTND